MINSLEFISENWKRDFLILVDSGSTELAKKLRTLKFELDAKIEEIKRLENDEDRWEEE